MINIARISHFLVFYIFFNSAITAQNREVIPFNENWKFFFSKLELADLILSEPHWKDVNIPHTWNNKDIQSGEKVNYATAWYKKVFNLKPKEGKQYFIRFEGVGQYAELYVNHKYVGNHLGSYSAFSFNITDLLGADTINTIHVKVNNELNDSYPKDNFLFGIFGGIYRGINLIITDDTHIGLTDFGSNGIYIHPKKVNKAKAVLMIQSMLRNDGNQATEIIITHKIMDNDKVRVTASSQQLLFPGGLVPVSTVLEMDQPHLWDGKKDPFLYTLTTELIVDGKVVDEVAQPYGFRYFEIDPEQGFILNGEKYRLYGVCRHQEWEDLGNALLPEHHRRDMELINEMGATSIRLAHYQQAEYIYELADSMGILVWAEIPFVNGYKEGADGNAIIQMTELIKQNFNHPSIFVWGVHNEVVKNGLIQEPAQLSSALHNLSKTLDPDRPTVAVSNLWWIFDHPIHELTDLQGFNQYTGWYGGKPGELNNWINNYHSKKPDVRFSISEYGAGGNISHQSFDIETVPNPTGQFFPEGYQTHYHETTWLAIEQSPFIWASYVWNMFDFSVPEWDRGGIKGRNHKGLITYDRQTKKDAFYWYKANWSDEPVLFLTGKRNNIIGNDTLIVKAYCNFSTPELFINGKSLGFMEKGINDVHFQSEVILKERNSFIEVKAIHDEKLVKDGAEININK